MECNKPRCSAVSIDEREDSSCEDCLLEIKIPSSFSLGKGQTAEASNHKGMQIKLLEIFPNGCLKGGNCIDIMVADSVKVCISLYGGCRIGATGCLSTSLDPPALYAERVIYAGGSTDIFGVRLELSSIKEKAVFEILFSPLCGNNICEAGEART